MQSDGVAASQVQRIALNAGLGQAAQLDASTAGVRDGNGVAADGSVYIGVVDVDTTGEAADVIILDNQLVSAPALSKYGVGVAVTAVIGSIKYIIMDIVGHLTFVVEVIVHIQTTMESAVFDFHFSGRYYLVRRTCIHRSRGSHSSAFSRSKFNIVDSQLSRFSKQLTAAITASHIRLDIAVSQLCLCAVHIVHTDDAVAGTENLMIASHSAVNLITTGLQGRKSRQRTVNVELDLGDRAGHTRVLVERSVSVGHVQVAFFPCHTEQCHISLVSSLAGVVLLVRVQFLNCGHILGTDITAIGQFYGHIVIFRRPRHRGKAQCHDQGQDGC